MNVINIFSALLYAQQKMSLTNDLSKKDTKPSDVWLINFILVENLLFKTYNKQNNYIFKK